MILFPLHGQMSAAEVNEMLGRGVNFGDCFEAGNYGKEIREVYPALISQWGFDAVRIPVKWSAWALKEPPYTIDPVFMDSVARVVDWSLENKLLVVLNIHHFDEIFDNPDAYEEMLLVLWRQIADRFDGYTDSLLFELLNEPHGNLTNERWNAMFPGLIDTIRTTHPTRKIVLGPGDWNGIGSIDKIAWPENDTNLILTAHYYNPFTFTHQGAEWVDGSDAWMGTTWDSTASQLQAVVNDLQKAISFSETHNVPVYIGEFGAYSKADIDSRRRWTDYCARTFENTGFSWAYWEFLGGFGVFDPKNMIWRNEILHSLTGMSDPNSIPPDPWEVSNGTFFNGTAGWYFQLFNNEVNGSFSVANEEAVIQVQKVNGTGWHIQLQQTGIQFIKGAEYELSFDGWSDIADAEIYVYTGRNGDPWDFYSAGYSFHLSEMQDKYGFIFTMGKDTDQDGRVVFNLGYDQSTIYLDNIEMKLLSMPVFVTGITIDAGAAEISTAQGTLQLTADVQPQNATFNTVDWAVVSGKTIATVSQQGLLRATGNANGTVVVEASAKDDSKITERVSVKVSNQVSGLGEKKEIGLRHWFSGDNLFVEMQAADTERLLLLYSITGEKLKELSLSSFAGPVAVPLSGLQPGIYLVKILSGGNSEIIKVALAR